MSKALHGPGEAHSHPAQQSVSGLFFLCSFLLLIGIPASSYVEIWAKACMHGGSSGVLDSGGMTMQRQNYYVPNTTVPVRFPEKNITGEEIADDSETQW